MTDAIASNSHQKTSLPKVGARQERSVCETWHHSPNVRASHKYGKTTPSLSFILDQAAFATNYKVHGSLEHGEQIELVDHLRIQGTKSATGVDWLNSSFWPGVNQLAEIVRQAGTVNCPG